MGCGPHTPSSPLAVAPASYLQEAGRIISCIRQRLASRLPLATYNFLLQHQVKRRRGPEGDKANSWEGHSAACADTRLCCVRRQKMGSLGIVRSCSAGTPTVHGCPALGLGVWVGFGGLPGAPAFFSKVRTLCKVAHLRFSGTKVSSGK